MVLSALLRIIACSDRTLFFVFGAGEPVRTDQESDLFAEGGFSFSQYWRFDAIGQYAAQLGRWQASSANLRTTPGPGYSASLAYRFT